MTYWICLPGTTLRLEAKGGYIVDATPSAEWTIGQAAVVALQHYRNRGAEIDWVKRDE